MSQSARSDAVVGGFPGRHRSVESKTKRATDVLVASIVLLLLAPLFAVVAALIRITSRGPVFFHQVRVGLDGEHFTLTKFRTMYVDNDDSAHRALVTAQLTGATESSANDGIFKLEDDPRITGVGSWLRRFSLDEVPQFINVLRGDMSIVGPRPGLPMEVDFYANGHMRRLSVLPGITGLWQVSGRNRLSMLEMLDLDIRYVDEWSPALDLRIIAATPSVMLRGDGAR